MGSDPYAAIADVQLGKQLRWPPRVRDRNRGAGYDLTLVRAYTDGAFIDVRVTDQSGYVQSDAEYVAAKCHGA